MPLRLSSLKNKLRTISFDYDGDSLDVTYRVGEVTPERSDRIADMVNGARNGTRTNAEIWADILAVVESWTIVGDDGTPLPVTAETLAQLPNAVLQTIAEEIADDAHPTKKRSRSSGGRSFAQ